MDCAALLTRWDADMPAVHGQSLTHSHDKFGKLPILTLPSHIDKSQLETLWSISKNGQASRVIEHLSNHKSKPDVNNDDNDDNDEDTRKILWENVDEGDIGMNSTKYGAIWTLEGMDSKSRRMRWTALHFCIYGWAMKDGISGKNKNAKLALGYKSHSQLSDVSNGDAHAKKKSLINHGEVLSNILSNRGYVDSLDYKCRTPLMLAAGANLFDAVKLLIEGEADVNISDIDGNTALHFAYGFGNASLAIYLEDHHADSDCKNLDGKTPLDMAGLANRLLPLFVPHKEEQEDISIVGHSSKWSISQQLDRNDMM